MKIQNLIIGILILCFPSFNSFGETYAEELITQITEYKEKMDAMPYDSYAGHPFCSEVINRKVAEDQFVLEKITMYTSILYEAKEKIYDLIRDDSTFFGLRADNDLELDLAANFPSRNIIDYNKRLNESPPSRSDGCLHSETPVLTLSYTGRSLVVYEVPEERIVDNQWKDLEKKAKEKFHVKSVPITEIETGQYLLSSTLAILKDPRYQMDCWAEAGEMFKSNLSHFDYTGFKEVEYLGESGNRIKIWVTPKHAFYACDDENCTWVSADALDHSSHILYSDKDKKFQIIWVTDSPPQSGNLEIFDPVDLKTFTFYIGPSEEDKILTHNMIIKT